MQVRKWKRPCILKIQMQLLLKSKEVDTVVERDRLITEYEAIWNAPARNRRQSKIKVCTQHHHRGIDCAKCIVYTIYTSLYYTIDNGSGADDNEGLAIFNSENSTAGNRERELICFFPYT